MCFCIPAVGSKGILVTPYLILFIFCCKVNIALPPVGSSWSGGKAHSPQAFGHGDPVQRKKA